MGIDVFKKENVELGAAGIVRVKSFEPGTLAIASPYAAQIRALKHAKRIADGEGVKKYIQTLIDKDVELLRAILGKGFREIVTEQSNLIMQAANVGKDLLVQRLLGTTTYTTIINYGALGTGLTAPTTTDTHLTTESARTVVAYTEDDTFNTALLQFFFPDSVLSNVTFNEFGTFIDGSSTPGSGQIFNHSLFTVPYAKTTGTDTTVEVDITFT